MKNIDLIIKKTLKNIILEKNTINRNLLMEESNFTFTTYKQPNGSSLLIPNNLEPKINNYNQSEWLTELTNPEGVKANYSNYVSSTNDTYAKSCNDIYTLQFLKEFNEKWIDTYIKILDPEKNTYPSDLNEKEGLKYYFTNKMLHEHFKEKLTAKDFIGTDYYFLKFQKWVYSIHPNGFTIEKGNINKLNNVSIATMMDKPSTIPSYLKIGEAEVNLPQSLGGGTISSDEVQTSWFQWSITKNFYCETDGSFIEYYRTMTSFVTNLYPDSVSEFEVSSETLREYLKYVLPENKLEKFNSENNGRVTFRSCWIPSYDAENGISLTFNGYYDSVVEFTRETIDNNTGGKCSGNKYPSMAVFLAAGDATYLDPETGNLWTESQGLINVPLLKVNEGYVGKYWKGKTERLKERNDGEYDMSQFGADLGLAMETTWAFLSGGFSSSEIADLSLKNSGYNPTFIDRKETFAMATPLTMGTKGLFKEEDYIDYTKVNEDTEVWKIPKGGLTPYIPGAKKHPKWNVKSPNGKYLYQYYYINYYNSLTGLEQELPLPSADWWDQYNSFFYKMKNFVRDKWVNKNISEVALCLTIQGGDNFAQVIETRGTVGWSFKIDTGTGTMFFAEGEKITYKSGLRTVTKGNDYSDPNNVKYGEAGELEAYNFMDVKFLDSRSPIGAFWDSHISTIVSILVGIAIGFAAAPLAEGVAIGCGWAIPAGEAGATATNLFVRQGVSYVLSETAPSYALTVMSQGAFTHSRLAVYIEIFLDGGLLTGPQAIYYFRNGDNVGALLTLMTVLVPFASERKTFSNWSRKIWTPDVAKSLSEAMAGRSAGFWRRLDPQKLFKFIEGLTPKEARAFGELLKQIEKNGAKAINEVFESYSERIITVLKESSELQKRIAYRFRDNVHVFARAVVPIGGGIFIAQTGIKAIVDYCRTQDPQLTEDQLNNLYEGLVKLAKYADERYAGFSNEEMDFMRTINPNFSLMDSDEWLASQKKENNDIWYTLIKNNGYEDIVEERKNQLVQSRVEQDKKIIEENLSDYIIYDSLWMGDRFKLEAEISIDRITGEITDITAIQDKIDLIKEYYGCVAETSLFEFIGAHKTSTGYWWVCFKVNGGTTIRNGQVFFFGKDDAFDIKSIGGLIPDWNPEISSDFKLQFPDCTNYQFINNEEEEYLYKKTKDGKIFMSLKEKIDWKEVTNSKQKTEIDNNFFK